MDNNILMEKYVDEVPLSVNVSLLKVDGDWWVIGRKHSYDSARYFYFMTPGGGVKASVDVCQAAMFLSAVEAFLFYKEFVEIEAG